jgi:hypothetical protein
MIATVAGSASSADTVNTRLRQRHDRDVAA